MNKHTGIALALAWPATWCKRAGAWYDGTMRLLGVSRNGYYQVGHAAVLLLKRDDDEARYFDMGRYHAPGGTARVRSRRTDHDLIVRTPVQWHDDHELPTNLDQLLAELAANKACHGDGRMHWAALPVIHDRVLGRVLQLQERVFIPYGPFLPGGSNCSRFVNAVIAAGKPPITARLLLHMPWTLSPTPMTNVQAAAHWGASGAVDPTPSAVRLPVFA